MKYIDAEKLLAEIEKWRDKAKEKYNESAYSMGRCDALAEFRNHIASLQQEQLVNKDLGTLITCDIIEMTVKRVIDKPQDKEKEQELMTRKINYLRSLEENYVQQEQPDVDNQ